jgi:hypothetical protein
VSIEDLISKSAGGYRKFALPHLGKISRKNPNGTITTLTIDLIKKGEAKVSAVLCDGDILFVPTRSP